MSQVVQRRLQIFALFLTVAAAGFGLVALLMPRDVHAQAGGNSYAQQARQLIEQQNLSALAAMAAPTGPASDNQQVAKWVKQYVTVMTSQAKLTESELNKQVTLARKYLKAGKKMLAFEHMLAAYAMSTDKPTFKKQPWVQKLTTIMAGRAKRYDKAGRWLESLEIYNELNSVYKISRRFHAQLHRVIRRTTLVAKYAPKAFYAMQKATNQRLLKKMGKPKKAGTQNAKPDSKGGKAGKGSAKPAAGVAPVSPTFQVPHTYHKWQNSVAGIHQDMMLQALEEARHEYVTPVSYNHMLTGGLRALLLMDDTPVLAESFPKISDAARRRAFRDALNQEMARAKSATAIDADSMIHIWERILTADTQSVQIPTTVVTREFADGCFQKLDKFSEIFWPSEVQEFDKLINGVFGGVGIQIEPHSGYLRVISPLSGTPAYKAGILPGDLIETVDGKSIFGVSLNKAIQEIMGKPGTMVTLGIHRGTARTLLLFPLKRANIRVHSIKGYARGKSGNWHYMIAPHSRIGYIRMTQFQQDTAGEIANALTHLMRHHMRGLIIDLRFNPGGLLETAINICNMFLPGGTILSTKGNANPRQVWTATGNPLVPLNIPIIILVNQDSASASEIFSGAMKDHHRATILGHRSYGKGCVQNIFPLGQNSTAQMKLTMAYYYLPNGECIQRQPFARTWGVEPAVTVPFAPRQLNELQILQMDNDILLKKPAKDKGKTKTAAEKNVWRIPEEAFDTQLDTAIMLLRLQILQTHGVARANN